MTPSPRDTPSPGFRRMMPARNVRRSGFTLIEILVTVAIIIALLGILLVIGIVAREWAKNRNTTASMAYLHNASLLYARALGGPAADVEAPKHYAVNIANGRKIPLTTMTYFVWRMKNLPDCTAQLERIPVDMRVAVQEAGAPVTANIYFQDPATGAPPALMASNYPLETVTDAWGNELKYCARAAATDPAPVPPLPAFDAAMTYADHPYFASAGKDGKWGNLAGHDRERPDADAKDNIYSMAENQ